MEKKITLTELAASVNGEVGGDGSILINGVADLANAGVNEICFISNKKYIEKLSTSKASAVIVPSDFTFDKKPVIKVKDPNLAFAVIHNIFLEDTFEAKGVSPKAVIGEECLIPTQVSIGHTTVLGRGVELGERVCLHPGVIVGDKVKIGNDCILHPNVTIYAGCCLGHRVIVHSGTVIGSDGFGYATTDDGHHVKRPHVGIVTIEDDVEIGANVCVDRGTFGKTRIRKGSKIDNLVQIAHNVDIGENSLVVAQVGFAGSSSIGKNVVLGGQTALAGHIHLGDRTMVGAKSGVHNDQKPDSVISGYPAIPHKKWLRASISLVKLPELINDVKKIKKQLF